MAAGLAIGTGLVAGALKLGDMEIAKIDQIKSETSTITDCMKIAGQDTCVRIFPKRVPLECHTVSRVETVTDIYDPSAYAVGVALRNPGLGIALAPEKKVRVAHLACGGT